MLVTPNCFILFEKPIDTKELPERFTFPFYYTPHPLCIMAANELQQYLLALSDNHKIHTESGKMFGVLLVKNQLGDVGYIAAYSGKNNLLDEVHRFVPAISNKYEVDEFFTTEQQHINQLTQQLALLETTPQLTHYQSEINKLQLLYNNELTAQQLINTNNRKKRKNERALASQELNTEELTLVLARLAIESVSDKNQTLALKAKWQQNIQVIESKLKTLTNAIDYLKSERQQRSATLQTQLFQQYQLLKSTGETKSLIDIFKPTTQHIPPAGSGDCAAPKLLQYAFKHNLTPIAMAEFWWGASPKSEIRQHKNYYPACIGKCEPILNWMLQGMNVDENPLLKSGANGKDIEIVYQDDIMAIINKPSGYLSVPGKHIQASVQTRIKELIPQATGPIIVHRLDMCTSGLMVIALTKRAHKALQKQFINRTVNKRYIALLNGKINLQTKEAQSGYITLPLRGDLHDRPRQLVCDIDGKAAETYYEVIEIKSKSPNVDKANIHNDNQFLTRIYLSPKTGRTHQLRVHCAHHLGLNTPILGDDLYGQGAERLHLHAEKIELDHPVTKERLCFQIDAEF